MRWVFRAFYVAGLVLALAGCYMTTKPIITQANAAWPFTSGTTFKSYSWKEETNAWSASGSGMILRIGDQYRLHPDPEPGQTADPGDEMDFLLADLGGGLYAAQAVDKDNHTILLDIAKVEGDTVYQYVLSCEPEDKALADQGIIDKFDDGQYSDTCTIGSLDQLRRAFQAKLAAGMIPHGKYVIVR